MKTTTLVRRILGVLVAAGFAVSTCVSSASAASGRIDDADSKQTAKEKRAEEKRLNTVWKTAEPVEGFQPVELFSAMASDQVEVSYKQINPSQANIIVKNKSDAPLAIEMPPAFAGVPVMAQLGPGGGGGGGGFGGQGGGGFGGQGGGGFGGGGQGGQGGQGTGGGFGGGQGGGGFGGGGGGFGGGGGGLGGQGGGGGIFNIPPGRGDRLQIATVCLEHGKPDPRAQMKYTIRPLNEFNKSPEIEVLCRLLASGQVDQSVAQAAAWNMTDGLSWDFLANMNRVELMDGYRERFFNGNQLVAAQQVVSWAKTQVETSASTAKTGESTEQELQRIENGGQ